MSTGMNWMNTSDCNVPDSTNNDPTHKRIYKLSHLIDPSPSQASVFLDEREDSIDNGAIGIYGLKNGVGFWNVPATRHGRGCNLTFADGHAEHWKWLDRWVVTMPVDLVKFTLTSPNDRDAKRLQLTVPFDY